MIGKIIRTALFAVMFAAASTTVVASPAQAVPAAGPYESIIFTYYSNASRTVVVGGWTYGNCLVDFQWGTRTSFQTWRRVLCYPQDPN